jgi:hypothetical protein
VPDVAVAGVTVLDAVGLGVSVTIFEVDVGCGRGVDNCVTTPVGSGTNVAVRATVGSGVVVPVVCKGDRPPAAAGIA